MPLRAEDIVTAIAEQLLDPKTVVAHLPPGSDTSLASGVCGTALLHARLAHLDDKFATAALHHWSTAMARLRMKPQVSHGIQTGRCGLAASLLVGSQYLPHPDRVHHATARSVHWLTTHVAHRCQQYAQQPHHHGTPWHIYDAITGLAGSGRTLLAAAMTGHAHTQHGLYQALTTLTHIINTRHGNRPGWWLSAPYHRTTAHVPSSGAAATGIAHGIAGPLAFLASAHTHGFEVPGQTNAITHAAQWLIRWQRPDTTWPPAITGTELDERSTTPSTTGRADAWCYGTPGITRALTLAGHALRRPELHAIADDALATMARRPASQWDTQEPTMCHGTAGVLQSTIYTHPGLADTAARHTVDTFNRNNHWRSHKYLCHNGTGGDPGVLTGAAGIALALAEYTQPTPQESSRWDCLFNLS